MKTAIDDFYTILEAARAAGALAGVQYIGKYSGDDEAMKSLKLPAILIGQGPEKQRANFGNRRRLLDASLQVTCAVDVGHDRIKDALEAVRLLADRTCAVIAAAGVAGSGMGFTGRFLNVAQSDPGLGNIGGNQVAQVSIAVTWSYSEYSAT